jgi:hypothetical protein
MRMMSPRKGKGSEIGFIGATSNRGKRTEGRVCANSLNHETPPLLWRGWTGFLSRAECIEDNCNLGYS